MHTIPQAGLRFASFRSALANVRGRAVSLQAQAVWTVWALLTVWAIAFVARHAYNLPMCDEWAFVSVYYASWAERFEWLGEPHQEHRFIAARAAFLLLLDVTDHDFRAGMYLSVALLSAAGAFLVLAARQLRGRTTLADVAYPALLGHLGHTENLLMSYQIAFTITVACLGLFCLLVARCIATGTDRIALACAAVLTLIALGGWLGLIFVPPLGGYVAWLVWRSRGTSVSRRIIAAVLLIAVAAYLAWSVQSLLLKPKPRIPHEPPPLAGRLQVVAVVTGVGLGSTANDPAGLARPGYLLLAVQAVTAPVLFVIGVRRRDERPVAWGLLAVLIGAMLFAGAVGFSRGIGHASRYTSFTVFGVVVPLLTIARYAGPIGWPRAFASTATVLAATVLVYWNAKHGAECGKLYTRYYEDFLTDARAGLPINVLARRHVNFMLGTDAGWEQLRANNFPLLRDTRPPLDLKGGIPVPFHRHAEKRDKHALLNCYAVELEAEKNVSLVRVTFRSHVQSTWEPMLFLWTDATTGEPRRSIVRPWVLPVVQNTVFWIDGPLRNGELLAGRPGCPIDIISIEYLPGHPGGKQPH